MSATELGYLSCIVPQLDEAQETPAEDDRAYREGIFTTLLQFIPRVVDFQPLILFLDDLHFADEATLLLLKQLMLRGETLLLICAAAGDSPLATEAEAAPLVNRFYAT